MTSRVTGVCVEHGRAELASLQLLEQGKAKNGGSREGIKQTFRSCPAATRVGGPIRIMEIAQLFRWQRRVFGFRVGPELGAPSRKEA